MLKYAVGAFAFILLFAWAEGSDLLPGAFLEALAATAIGVACMLAVQVASYRWYSNKSTAKEPSENLVNSIAIVSMVAAGIVMLYAMGKLDLYGFDDQMFSYILGISLFASCVIGLNRFLKGRFKRTFQDRAKERARVNRQKSEIINMINNAISTSGSNPK
jgi:cytochrome bd-type quinol oxidase subunit 2